MSGNVKNILISVVVLAIIGAAGYFYMTRTPEVPTLLIGTQTEGELSKIDNDFLTNLRQLQRIQLNKDIFDNGTWKTFEDFGKKLNEEPKGRPNPFAPVVGSSEQFGAGTSTTGGF